MPWTPSTGTGGRHPPETVVAFNRKPWSPWTGTRNDQHLVVVQNLGIDRTVELVSTDSWKSAKVVRQLKSVMSMPSSATQVDKDVYVLNSRIDTLFDPKAAKVSDFVLQKF